MTAVYPLPARLDLSAAGPLARDLLSRRGASLTLRADAVTHLGTPGLQVLLAARRSWREDGHRLIVDGPSPSLVQHLALFGLGLADLSDASGEHAS